MNVIVVGCTAVGVSLASELCKNGFEVAIIDRDQKLFCDLPSFFKGVTVTGAAMDVEVLQNAGITECDAFVAVSDDDNLNIVAAQLAKEMFSVPNVITRIADPVREKVFQDTGLKTVCPTNVEGVGIYHLVTGEAYDNLVSFGNRKARFITRKDPGFVGKRVCDLPLFQGEIVYAIVDQNGELALADDRARIITEGESVVFSSLAD